MDPDSVIAILISLIFSAFFSGIEIAFISANKLRIELKNKQGSPSGKLLSKYLKDPSKFISTSLVGNNIALVVYGIFSGKVLEAGLEVSLPNEFVRFVVVTILSTLLVLVTAEFLPKALFRLNSDRLIHSLIFPFHLFYIMLWPLVWILTGTSKIILKGLLKTEIASSSPVFTKLDLDNLVSQTGHIEMEEDNPIDKVMFKNALDFGSLKARDCMIPRTEIIAVEESEGIETLYQVFIESGHSKILVYRDNIDNIIGYVHQVGMLNLPKELSKVIIPIIITNESKPVLDLLNEFTQQRKSIAVVVDEFGGTAGIITIEDIIEEIFGDIDDEYDTEDLKETQISEGRYIFSGRLSIEYLNDTYQLSIPEGDYETLGGYIISISERIPKEKEIIMTEKYEIIVLSVKNARIEEIEIKSLR